jgi:hypothetical protein
MSWVTDVRGILTRTAVAAAIIGAAAAGASVAANPTPAGVPAPPTVQADPGCDAFGWRHPLCGGGAWDFGPVADDGIPGDNAAEGGIPAPASVPNVDGSLSPPGMPGDV